MEWRSKTAMDILWIAIIICRIQGVLTAYFIPFYLTRTEFSRKIPWIIVSGLFPVKMITIDIFSYSEYFWNRLLIYKSGCWHRFLDRSHPDYYEYRVSPYCRWMYNLWSIVMVSYLRLLVLFLSTWSISGAPLPAPDEPRDRDKRCIVTHDNHVRAWEVNRGEATLYLRSYYHGLGTFSAQLTLCEGIRTDSRIAKSLTVMKSFDVFLLLSWTSCWINCGIVSVLQRHCKGATKSRDFVGHSDSKSTRRYEINHWQPKAFQMKEMMYFWSKPLLYPRSTAGGMGVYWIHPDVCLSVRPSVYKVSGTFWKNYWLNSFHTWHLPLWGESIDPYSFSCS